MAKWTRFDSRYREDLLFALVLVFRPGFEDSCYAHHLPLVKSGEDGQLIQLRRMPIRGPVPTPKTTVAHSFRLTFRRRRMASFLLLFISRA